MLCTIYNAYSIIIQPCVCYSVKLIIDPISALPLLSLPLLYKPPMLPSSLNRKKPVTFSLPRPFRQVT
jgi:hypothetical protein